MGSRLPVIAAGLLAMGLAARAAAGPVPDALTRARQAYNAQQFDQAIAAADEAARLPALAAPAAVIGARAHLERFRSAHAPEDLAAARDALKALDASQLSPRDHTEYVIGLGESLYFEEHFSAAAETFAAALGASATLDADTRERLLEWWANAMDQHAQVAPDNERREAYQRLLDRMDHELANNPRSAVATYWVAAAARGADDINRAWGAAVSGWIRARGMPAQAAALRADLDRLVRLAILPERARRASPADPVGALTGFQQEWERLKKDWSDGP